MASKKSKKTTAKKAVKSAKKHPVLVAFVVILLVVIIAAVAVLYFWKPELFHRALGLGEHTWSEWTVETANDCGNDGLKTRECTVCGEKESEVLPATGEHTWSEWKVENANDCGNDGLKTRECTVCGEKESEVLPATGEHTFGDDGVCVVCGYDPASAGVQGSEEEIAVADLSIHFLELENKATGDCILIKSGDTEVLIDAGSEQGCATTLKSYIDQYCTDGVLEYVISTHADQDHIAAFVGNASGSTRTGLLYQYEIGTLIKFDRTDKALTTASGNKTLYAQYLDALDYIQSGDTPAAVYTASQCYEQIGGAQRQYYLDEAHTVSINILYNYYYYNDSKDENNYSVVTLLTQELESGNKYYLFTGDLEEDGESRLVDYYVTNASDMPAEYKTDYNILPGNVELYKAGHHGSKTSSTAKLIDVIQPKNVVVCCVAGTTEYTVNNANTFPTQQMIDNVGKYTENIYVPSIATGLSEYDPDSDTFASKSFGGYESLNGNVVFYTVNGKLKLYCSSGDYTVLKDTEWFLTYREWKYI